MLYYSPLDMNVLKETKCKTILQDEMRASVEMNNKQNDAIFLELLKVKRFNIKANIIDNNWSSIVKAKVEQRTW